MADHSERPATNPKREPAALGLYRQPGTLVKGERNKMEAKEKTLSELVREAAKELDAALHGEMKICPRCGQEVRDTDREFAGWDDEYDEPSYVCDACGVPSLESEWDEKGVFDFFQDCMDINHVLNANGKYLGSRVIICSACPELWIDTISGKVVGESYNRREEWPLDKDELEILREFCRDEFDCLQ